MANYTPKLNLKMPLATEGYSVADQNGNMIILDSAVDGKVPKPLTGNGTNGQLLRTNGDGTTAWTTQGAPTDEQVSSAVEDWLDENVDPATGYVLDRTLSMSNAATPADITGSLKSAFDAFIKVGKGAAFCKTVSGTKYVGYDVSINAGWYDLIMDAVSSSDTDESQSQVRFDQPTSGNHIYIKFDRNTAYNMPIKLAEKCTKIYFYASTSADKSEGDTFKFSNFLVAGIIPEYEGVSARLENNASLVSMGGGKYKLANLRQGTLQSDSNNVIHPSESSVNVSMQCYAPQYPNDTVEDKNTKPIYLNKGDSVMIASGYTAFLYCVEPDYYNGELYYKNVEHSIGWATGTAEVSYSGLYFVGRIRKETADTPITPAEGEAALTIQCGNSTGKRLDAVEYESNTARLESNTARLENNASLVSMGGGKYKLANLRQGTLQSDSNNVIHPGGSSVNVSMQCYAPQYPNDTVEDKNTKPICLNKGDSVMIASGYTAFMYCVEPDYYNGELYYKNVDHSIGWFTDTAEVSISGLYFVARIRKTADDTPISPAEGEAALTIQCGNSIGKRLDAVEYESNTARLENNASLVSMGGGKYRLKKLRNGTCSVPENGIIVNYGSVVNCCMECYSPAEPEQPVNDKNAKPIYLNKGDKITVSSGYQVYIYEAMPDLYNGETCYKWVASYGWITGTTYTMPKSALFFIARIRKVNTSETITPNEAEAAVLIECANNIGKRLDTIDNILEDVETGSKIILNNNPYPTAFSAFLEVISTTHCHGTTDEVLAAIAAKYDHVAISNYYPSAPWYPLSSFYSSVPSGFISSPNGEQAHFTDSAAGVHICSVGSYLARDTASYGGTLYECVRDIIKMLQYANGGGATINHPTYSGLSGADICTILDNTSGVFAMEIYNSNSEAVSQNGYSITQWDDVLATGRQIYGVAVPDHEVELRPQEDRIPFGYCHVLVRAKTEQEILYAYRAGRFYSSIRNDSLKFTNIVYAPGSALSVEVSESCTIKFITANGTVSTETGTTASYTPTSGDVYVRVEATNGTNTLYSNAVILI